MFRYCSNCGKRQEKGEKCPVCNKTMGMRLVCVKLGDKSLHFDSRECAQSVLADASYRTELKCPKCSFRWKPPEIGIPVCPECSFPYSTPKPF